MSPRRILVAGIGNIFLSDDGFGVEVAAGLMGLTWPEGVTVEDVGIRGVHLAYQLLDGYDLLVLVDAVGRGDPPGTLTLFEPVLDAGDPGIEPSVAAQSLDSHGMNPAVVLSLAQRLGARLGRVVVVGCEPAVLDDGIGLSEPVKAAVGPAIAAVVELVGSDAGAGGTEAARERASTELQEVRP